MKYLGYILLVLAALVTLKAVAWPNAKPNYYGLARQADHRRALMRPYDQTQSEMQRIMRQRLGWTVTLCPRRVERC